jgi:CBS domain containing-hemolysin-like protein
VSLGAWILLFALVLGLSATFSGSETGFYRLSRVRLDAEARRGRRRALLLRGLLTDESALLITLLIGNNLMLELATKLFELRVERLAGVPAWSKELVIALTLTPVVFFFGELLPKELFRQRPHQLLGLVSPLISLARKLFLVLSWPLGLLSRVLQRAFGIGGMELARVLRREEVLEFLLEGRSGGSLDPQAGELARNVLGLRETPVAAVMIAWPQAFTVELAAGDATLRELVGRGPHTRVPAVAMAADGTRRVAGYLHQLEVLRLGEQDCAAEKLHPLPSLPADLPVDRALGRMRVAGRRIALVGEPEAPQGLVTLMDLVAAISGGLHA